MKDNRNLLAALLLVALSSLATPQLTFAQISFPVVSVIEMCNRGQITIQVARAYSTFSDWEGVNGWYRFPPGKCYQIEYKGFQGHYWFYFGYIAKDGTFGQLRVREYDFPRGKRSDDKFFINPAYKDFNAGFKSKLGDDKGPERPEKYKWIEVVFPAYIKTAGGKYKWKLWPDREDTFCPLLGQDVGECFTVSDYEDKPRNTKPTANSNPEAAPAEKPRQATPQDIRDRKRLTEHAKRLQKQTDKCDAAAGCDVQSEPFMYRPFGESTWYDTQSQALPERRWPDLLPRRNLGDRIPWVTQLTTLLSDHACGARRQPEVPIIFSDSGGKLKYLWTTKTRVWFSWRVYYEVASFDLDGVYIDGPARKVESSGCWLVKLTCVELRCIEISGATKPRKSKDWLQQPPNLTPYKKTNSSLSLVFDSQESAETAVNALPTKSVRPQSVGAGIMAVDDLLVGFVLTLILFTVPNIIAGLIWPARFYPFSNPSRTKALLYSALLLPIVAVAAVALELSLAPSQTTERVGLSWAIVGMIIGIALAEFPLIRSFFQREKPARQQY